MTTPRRQRVWSDLLLATGIADGGQALDTLLGNVTENEAVGSTLVRLVLHLKFTVASVGSVVGEQALDIGVGVASQEAFAAGTVPDPNVSLEYPQRGWVWVDRFWVRDSTARDSVFEPEVTVDIRSARRIDRGVVYLVANNTSQFGTGFIVRMSGRVRLLRLLA